VRPTAVRCAARAVARDSDLAAPHLLDIEFLHALRRLVLGGQLGEDRAGDARLARGAGHHATVELFQGG
jgi:hypothetical protein